MQITDEQLNIIYDQISNGISTRNKILDELSKDDDLLKNVLNLHRNEKDEIYIAEKLQTSVEMVREKIKTVEQLSKKIDAVLAEKYNTDYKRSKSESTKKEEQKMHVKTKKSLYQKQIKEFLGRYREAKDKGQLDKLNLQENARKFEAKLNYIGDRISFRLYLADMYLYIGNVKKVREILSGYDFDTLTEMEKRQYKNIEDGIITQENKAIIGKLCEKGLDYQGILNECEKVPTGNRIYLKPKVIKEYMTEYLNKKSKEEKER